MPKVSVLAAILLSGCTVSPPTDGYSAHAARSVEGSCSSESKERILRSLREISPAQGMAIAGDEEGTRIVTLAGSQAKIIVSFGVFNPGDVMLAEYPATGAASEQARTFDTIAAAVRECDATP